MRPSLIALTLTPLPIAYSISTQPNATTHILTQRQGRFPRGIAAIRDYIQGSDTLGSFDYIHRGRGAWLAGDIAIWLITRDGPQAQQGTEPREPAFNQAVRDGVLQIQHHSLIQLRSYYRALSVEAYCDRLRHATSFLRLPDIRFQYWNRARFVVGISTAEELRVGLEQNRGRSVPPWVDGDFMRDINLICPDFRHSFVERRDSPEGLGFVMSWLQLGRD